MEARAYDKEIQAPQPAVTEKRVVLNLSEHEARVLRALVGKLCGGGAHYRAIAFLGKLDELFPGDYLLPEFGGIKSYTVRSE